MKRSITIPLCITVACLSATPANACRYAVNNEISKFGVTPDQVTKMTVSRNVEAGEDGRRIGSTYWLTLKQCSSGQLIVDTDTTCRVTQIYTTGACEVSGVHKC